MIKPRRYAALNQQAQDQAAQKDGRRACVIGGAGSQSPLKSFPAGQGLTAYIEPQGAAVSKKEARSISLRVRITPKLLRELKRLAEENRRTVSNYVCVVLEEHVAASNERPPTKR